MDRPDFPVRNVYADSELGYAVTDHVAQGRPVHTGLAVITGTEDRQHAYVALSRGTDANLAYVFTFPQSPTQRPARGRPRNRPLRPPRRRTRSQPDRGRTGEALAVLAACWTGTTSSARPPGPPPGPGRP